MQFQGVHCKIHITAGGRDLVPVGPWTLTEDILEGSALELRLAWKGAPDLQVGQELKMVLEEPQRRRSSEVILWVDRIAEQQGANGDLVWVSACDPLSLARDYPEFRTHAGKIKLGALARRVLARSTPFMATKPRVGTGFPAISVDWLLQAEESGAAFLRRCAADLQQALHWGRTALCCTTMGGPAGECLAPDPSRDLFEISRVTGLPRPTGSVQWTDPVLRHTTSGTLQGDIAGEGNQRHAGFAERALPARSAGNQPHAWGRNVRVTGALFSARPGTSLDLGDGTPWWVERCDHEFMGDGSYRTSVLGVRKEDWGLGAHQVLPGMIGPYQATVTHNHDPEGQGRIRVALAEDPEGRTSPFIPMLELSPGQNSGSCWKPEVNDQVLVVAPRQHPEALVCLGAIRDHTRTVPEDWRRKDNGVKALFSRAGMGLYLDEKEKTIRLETPDARVIVGGGGKVTILAKEILVKSDQKTKIDGSRIDLG